MTVLAQRDRELIRIIQHGLPLVSRPYAAIGEQIGMTEAEVIVRIKNLLAEGVIKRIGVVVRHRELGYRANGMVVWDVPDEDVAEVGHRFAQFDFVTLCYRRQRQLPQWRYNLFCMIHGRDRSEVLRNLDHLVEDCDVQTLPREILFSGRCFKQRGAIYIHESDNTWFKQVARI